MDKSKRRCIIKDQRDLNYEEFLNKTQNEPSREELNNTEKVLCKASVSKKHQKPLNNFNYKPF